MNTCSYLDHIFWKILRFLNATCLDSANFDYIVSKIPLNWPLLSLIQQFRVRYQILQSANLHGLCVMGSFALIILLWLIEYQDGPEK